MPTDIGPVDLVPHNANLIRKGLIRLIWYKAKFVLRVYISPQVTLYTTII